VGNYAEDKKKTGARYLGEKNRPERSERTMASANANANRRNPMHAAYDTVDKPPVRYADPSIAYAKVDNSGKETEKVLPGGEGVFRYVFFFEYNFSIYKKMLHLHDVTIY
jgi:hypothetical protein